MSEYNGFTEAPVSFNVKAYAPAGFDVMLTLRSTDGADLMPRALAALDWLTDHGFTPRPSPSPRPSPVPQAAPSAGGANGSGANDGGPAAVVPTCPVHQEPMKESKFGGWYCPVKVADDDGTGRPVYCKHKVK